MDSAELRRPGSYAVMHYIVDPVIMRKTSVDRRDAMM